MKIAFVAPGKSKGGALALAVFDGGRLSASAQGADEASGGAIKRALDGGRFTGKKGQFLEILSPSGLAESRLLLFGLGKEPDLGDLDFERVGGGIWDAFLEADPRKKPHMLSPEAPKCCKCHII